MSESTNPETQKQKLTWYQQAWIGLPFIMMIVGGLIGGLCGGAAWAINQAVFQKTKHPVLRYVWTGLISAASVIAYIVIVTVIFTTFKKHS
jgi:hypothetical protein